MTPLRLLSLLLLLAAHPAWAEPVRVTLAPLLEVAKPLRHEAPATAVGLEASDISPQVAGTVQAIYVEVGDRVETGAKLVGLDAWEYRAGAAQARAALKEMEARIDMARRQLKRGRTLRKKGQASAELLDRRETDLTALLAQKERQRALLREAEARVAKCIIKAPFPGVVTQRHAQAGEWAAPGTALLRLINPDRVLLSANIPPRLADALTNGRSWRFVHPGGEHPAQLETLLPSVQGISRTREARLAFTDSLPPPGAAGRLVWESAEPHIPAAYLVRRNGALGLFLAAGGKAVFHPIPSAQEGRPALLPEGLSGQLVIQGREGLKEGAALNPTEGR